ncbi:MAG: DNA (cytosine-5-)-methyltransferase [bacterium]|nr:DNA (cytosine-5-)-methyltransferase [bacterium]MCY4193123.1 DNA (cytosine-5-)-methyltransferase [bacterium]MCY4272841.1 DNA (cytosine-5-)-methyltransferase [bacterium]
MGDLTALSMFSGAGGLDLGFEAAGFTTVAAVDHDPNAVDTLRKNRPEWNPVEADVRDWAPEDLPDIPDVLIAGPPCQGFSLGGNRQAADDRNGLFREVCRVARQVRPRVVIIENVLNLRTMLHPGSGRPFVKEIAVSLAEAGYGDIAWDVFKMDGHGVPQTRRRFVFVAFRNNTPDSWHLPAPSGYEPIRPWLWDLAHDDEISLPNHDPSWGFKSQVHVDRGEDPGVQAPISVVRFSRTASDGNPIRDWDRSFPAVDTATVWGLAQGHVCARREPRDRGKGAKFVRNPDTDVTLWRIQADRLRSLTHREYARLQTFPDSWEFIGGNKRDVHLQIGNAVPVQFAEKLGRNIQKAIRALDTGQVFPQLGDAPLRLF